MSWLPTTWQHPILITCAFLFPSVSPFLRAFSEKKNCHGQLPPLCIVEMAHNILMGNLQPLGRESPWITSQSPCLWQGNIQDCLTCFPDCPQWHWPWLPSFTGFTCFLSYFPTSSLALSGTASLINYLYSSTCLKVSFGSNPI